MVQVRIAYTDGIDWQRAKTLPLVTPQDVEGADRYVQAEDKVLHLVSAYLKRRFVGDWEVSASGKPMSQGTPFNVSHTEGAVAIALSPREVGVDVERVRPTDEQLRDYVCTPLERERVHTDADFFRIWTAKESLIKAQGKGLDRHPNAIPALPLEGVRTYLGERYYCRQTQLGDLVLAVAVRGEEPFEWEICSEPLPIQKNKQ